MQKKINILLQRILFEMKNLFNRLVALALIAVVSFASSGMLRYRHVHYNSDGNVVFHAHPYAKEFNENQQENQKTFYNVFFSADLLCFEQAVYYHFEACNSILVATIHTPCAENFHCNILANENTRGPPNSKM